MANGSYRRGSYFSGLLFIALGVLLLAYNYHPEIRAWERIYKWWPVLLILWGVAKLVENLMARRAGRPPGRLLTGGEVFLLFLVICVASAITAGRPFFHNIDIDSDGGWPFGQTAEMTEELPPKPVQPGTQILIQTQRGDITVEGADEQEVRIVAKKTGMAIDEEAAQKLAREAKVVLVDTPGGLEIRPEAKTRFGERVRVSFEVHVPRRVLLDLKAEDGDLRATNIGGNLSAIARRGTVEVRDVGGDVRAETLKGDVRVAGAKGSVRITGKGGEVEISDVNADASVEGEFYGPIRLRNIAKGTRYVSSRTDLTLGPLPGRMEMDRGDLRVDDASGNILLTTREKDIDLENVTGRVRIENKHGEVAVRLHAAPKEEISITNESGGVELALPSASSFEVDAYSRSGEIENEFDDPTMKVSQDNQGNSTLVGKRGGKGPRVALKTTYGQIRIRKSD